ncbi:response regulator [Aquabacterium sp. A7-Y]|uniref:response regulator n=1 Tax=Aquabacterium sp. A7-Y TaxID=1349605 RepID=UPI00223D7893|nr:response regulator [Aquabacterium sp. A7-Y]MCW7541346.1 response regulator [Aquabacterium sp. A7-Y]
MADTAATFDRLQHATPLILVAEDEAEIADILAAYLQRDGFRTVLAPDGVRALELHMSLKPDLVVLDIKMPRLDGWGVLTELRRRGDTPVIVLTARDQDIDKLLGLRMGADDYVIKPFNCAEAVARVHAVLRRSLPPGARGSRLRAGAFEIDIESHEATARVGAMLHPLELTLTEFRLLTHLARSPKRVFSREELLLTCLPEGSALERTVDSHLSKLRKKLERLGIEGVPLSVRGVGYRLDSER